MTKRIAIIGDVHGCIEELTELLDRLAAESLDAIYHLGDLVDRGPDSGAVVALMRDRGVSGVLGNHDSRLLELLRKFRPAAIKNEEKHQSAVSVTADPANLPYLNALPKFHVIDGVMDSSIVLVHGGLWPAIPLWQQPSAVMMAQLIDPHKPGAVAWLNDVKGQGQGWVPWWDVWDGPETVVFGHTVFREPQIFNRTIGIDTGCVFGGSLTAMILPDLRFVQVKARRAYAERDNLYRDDDFKTLEPGEPGEGSEAE